MLLPCRFEVCTEQVERSRVGHTAEVGSAPASYGQCPTLHFSVADHKHKWDLRLLRFSDFESYFFIPKVCLSAKPRSLELGHNLSDIIRGVLSSPNYELTVKSGCVKSG